MTSRKDTLLILTPGFPKNEADTACLPPQQVFVKALARQFPHLSVVVLAFQYPFMKGRYEWSDIDVISFGGEEKGGLSRLLLWRRVYKKLNQLNRENKIIGILSFWCGECAYVAKKFAGKHAIRHYCWILGQDAKKDNRYIARMNPQAGELVALSDFIQNEFQKNHGVRPQYVIPPGIDGRLFKQKITERDIDLLAAGSLIPLKQHGIFIEVIAELKKTFPQLKVMLTGKGPQKEEIKKNIDRFHLQDTIKLTGELPHQDVLQLMQRTRVFLHPSVYEGFGVVCIEALYAGAAVISFCKPMEQEIKNWHIVASKEAMILKATELLQSPLHSEQVCPYPIEETVKRMMDLFYK
jgi:glycosyltransferase involved in cell wall biosynthesis